MLLFLTACSSGKYDRYGKPTMEYYSQLKEEYIRGQCESSSLVGDSTEIKLLVDAKREGLESVKASIGYSQYSKLSQKLEGYTVEWEILHKELERSCNKNAACRFDYRENHKMCKSSEAAYATARKDMLHFILKLRSTQIQ
jgi:hypothetical protein